MALLLSNNTIRLLQLLECPIAYRLGMLNSLTLTTFTHSEVHDTYSLLKSAVKEGLLSRPDQMTAAELIQIFEKEFPWCN
jgi:hypothetical protein